MPGALSTQHELGSAYRRVVELPGGELALGRREHLFSLFAGETDLLHFDLEGRLHRAWLDGRSYQRGLDGRVRRVEPEGAGTERAFSIEVMEPAGAETVLRRVDALVLRAEQALSALTDPELAELLRLAAARVGAAARAEEARRFSAAYEPIPILPPDQNRALVVQLTSGCSWNRCEFCHLYKDARFAMKSPVELREHVERVLSLVGRALPLRRGVFLGQANALVLGRDKLLPLLSELRRLLDVARAPEALRSYAAFIDAFSKPKPVAELCELGALGLRSVSLGLESGSDRVLSELGKPAESEAAVALVDGLHTAGIGVGVIVLVGAGGRRLASAHVEATVATLLRMGLGPGDRVYLSPLVPEPGVAERRSLVHDDVLDRAELGAQARSLSEQLRAGGVRVPIALYDLRRFVY
jgi:hypothetical protein